MDTQEYPTVYVSHSFLFHGDIVNYNGKVSAVSGPDMVFWKDVVTGLPVSDHDHGINGIEFDNDGNLLIQVGGNTNAGVPGALSSSGLQQEDALSAATLIARNVKSPNFDGIVKYDGTQTRNQVSGFGVEVFCSGLRNPFDLVLHSNGKLYSTGTYGRELWLARCHQELLITHRCLLVLLFSVQTETDNGPNL
jgi:glucose/arabinose dehydrogenase